MKRTIVVFSVLLIYLLTSLSFSAENRLDYLGVDQTYDKIPGTLASDHIPWARPLAGGKLKTFFLVTNSDSREVVEFAQRLEMDYTVLMTAKLDSFFDTDHTGRHAVPQYSRLVRQLAEERLHPAKHYDLLVVGKIAWRSLPDFVRENLLSRVKAGAGLLLLETPGRESDWAKDFGQPEATEVATDIYRNLPMKILPLVPVKEAAEALAELKKRKGAHWHTQDGWRGGGWWTVGLAPITLKVYHFGKGRVVVVDYYEGGKGTRGLSLTPSNVEVNDVGYDLCHAFLTKIALWTAGKSPEVQLVPLTPDGQTFNRTELKQKEFSFEITPRKTRQLPYKVEYTLRNIKGTILLRKTQGIPKYQETRQVSIPLLPLPKGTYLLDVWVKEELGDVLDFASRSFSVETEQSVVSITTQKDCYRNGEIVKGEVTLTRALVPGEALQLLVKDTWDRIVHKMTLQTEGSKASFSFPVKQPLSSLWDVYSQVVDASGVVAENSCFLGIPNYTIDNYLFSQFYGLDPSPLTQIKIKKSYPQYGINCAYPRSVLWGGEYNKTMAKLLGSRYESELAVRNNLRIAPSVFPNGLGGSGGAHGSIPGPEGPVNKSCLNNPEKSLDPQVKDWKMWADKDPEVTCRFGTVANWVCGESFLPLDVCFCSYCIAEFRKYVIGLYGTIEKLNAEYGTSYKSFSEVTPLPEPKVFEENRIPMWLDHKMFMFNGVYTTGYRKVAKRMAQYHEKVRATTVDMWFVQPNYGVSPFDWPEMFKDVTSYATEVHSFHQWEALIYEITGSLTHGEGLQIVRTDPWWFWETEHWKAKTHPWWNLFHGGHMSVFHGWGPEDGIAGGCPPLTADMSEPMEWFRILSNEIQEIQQGIGPLLIQSKRHRDPIVIVLSTVNVFASLLDPMGEMNYDNNHRDFFTALQSLGLTPEFLGERDLSADSIKSAGYKAIVLPYHRAMSKELAETLRAFVKKGGLLIADDKPGVMDEHCKALPSSIVADLFPSFDKKPYSRQIGKGYVLYTGGELIGLEGRINSRDFGPLQGLKESIKKFASISEPIRLLDRYGLDRRDSLMSLFVNGKAKYLTLLRHPNIKEADIGSETKIIFGEKVHVYDLRKGAYLGCQDQLDITLPQYEAKVFALLPRAPSQLQLQIATPSVKPGSELPFRLSYTFEGSGKQDQKLGLGVHLVVRNPKGEVLKCYTQNIMLHDKTYQGVLPVAFNAEEGRYSVEVVSISTGHRASGQFDIR